MWTVEREREREREKGVRQYKKEEACWCLRRDFDWERYHTRALQQSAWLDELIVHPPPPPCTWHLAPLCLGYNVRDEKSRIIARSRTHLRPLVSAYARGNFSFFLSFQFKYLIAFLLCIQPHTQTHTRNEMSTVLCVVEAMTLAHFLVACV